MARKRSGRKTNVEIVTDIMEWGNPMKQLVVVTAIEKYAELCIEAGPERFDSGMINGRAWIQACHEILRELKEAYGR